MTEAIPGERKMRLTMDIQRASSVTVNKYTCADIHIRMQVCTYVYVRTHRCVCTNMERGEREGRD